MKIKKLGFLLLLVLCVGCLPHQSTIDLYNNAAPRVQLGMTKAEVLDLLKHSQRHLRNTEIKQPDMFRENGVLVEILYFRSGWQDDGLTTDDEFTPYIFKDKTLVAVGWETLGGPKTQGQAVQQNNIYKTRIVKPTKIYIEK